MLNYPNYAVTLGRAVNLFADPLASREQRKGALRALVALAGLGEAEVSLEDEALSISNREIPVTLPFVPELTDRIRQAGLRRIEIARGVSAMDLFDLVRGLAGVEPGITARFGGETPGILRVEAEEARRPATVTAAFEREAVLSGAGETVPRGAVEPARRDSTPEEELQVATLRLAAAGPSDDTEQLVREVEDGVRLALGEGDDASALDGLATLVNLEREHREELRGPFTAAIQRLVDRDTLLKVAHLLMDSAHHRLAMSVLLRAGSVGTDAVVEQLTAAPSQKDRETLGAALFAMEDGTKKLVALLRECRGEELDLAIELVGYFTPSGGEQALARVAADHPDEGVRLSAYKALVEYGTRDAGRALAHGLMGDLRGQVEEALVGPLPEPIIDEILVLAERTPVADPNEELMEVLGSSGHSRALEYLIKSATSGGRFFGRKPVGVRKAAIAGLSKSDAPAAVGTLEELCGDRNVEIGNAARAALEAQADRQKQAGQGNPRILYV